MRALLRALLVVAVPLAVVLGAAYWVAGTQGGTNWLLRQAADRTPEGLVIGSAEGTLLRGIEFDTIEWHSDTVRLQARKVALQVELLPLVNRHLIVPSLSAAAVDVRLFKRTETRADDTPFSVDLPIDITLHAATLHDVRYADDTAERRVREISLAGELRGSRLQVRHLAVRSDWADLDLAGSIELADAFAFDASASWHWKDAALPPLAGQLRATGTLQAIEIDHQLREPLAVASTGRLAFEAGTVRADLVNEWQQQQWDLPQGTLSSSRGRLHVRGQADELLIDLDVLAGLDGGPEAALVATGDARWQPQPGFAVSYRVADLDPGYLRDGLAGSLASRGRLSGALQDGVFGLDLQTEELRGEINGYPLEGAVTGRYAPGDLLLSEAYIRIGDNLARMQGRIGERIALDVSAELGAISQVVPDMAGSARGRVALQGTAASPDVRGELDVADFATRGVRIDRANIRIAGSSGEHELQATVSAYDTETIVAADGEFGQRSWSGTVTRLEIDNPLAGRWIANGTGAAAVSPALSRLAEICLERVDTPGMACLGGAYTADGSAAIDVSVRGLPIAALPIVLPAGVGVTGFANARVTAARVNQRLRADARLEFADTAFDAVYMDESFTLALAEAQGQASVVNNRLDSSFRIVTADGSGTANVTLAIPDIMADQPLLAGNGGVEISDASLFALFVPGISRPQGRIHGEIEISGYAAAPELIGTVRVTDGTFGVRPTGIAITELNMELSQFQPGQIRLSGSARSGEGMITVDGNTWVGQDLGIRSEVKLTGENFELARLPNWQVSASPDISAVFDDRVTRITGELAIPSARVTMREVPQTAVQPSSDTVVHREDAAEPERRRRIDIDVRASLGDDVSFTGFGLTADLEGSVLLRGGTHAPYTGQGKLSLIDGRYKAYGQELRIERGDLIFNGPIGEPLLDVLAVRQARDVRTGIQLSGTPSRLQSEIFSDPVLSDAEALSYLLTGRPLADTTSTSEGQALDQAAFALGLSGAGLISAQIRAQLGLETLTIEGIGDESRLIAGKRLGERLLVEYGYGLVDKLGTLLLRYQLNERLVLESRTGTVSNFDIVYRRRKD